MKPEFEFSDLYKFLVSLGLILIGIAIFFPAFLLGLSFNIDLTQVQIQELPKQAQDFILIRQQLAYWLILNWLYISTTLAVIGFISGTVGIYYWRNNQQRWQDDLEKTRVEKEKRDAGIPTPEQLERLAVERVYGETSLTPESASPESQLKLANFWELRSAIVYQLKNTFKTTHIFLERTINSHNYIILQARNSNQNTSPLIKIKYFEKEDIVNDAEASLASLVMDVQLYLRVFLAQHIDLIDGPLAILLFVLPDKIISTSAKTDQSAESTELLKNTYKEKLAKSLRSTVSSVSDRLVGKIKFHFLFEQDIVSFFNLQQDIILKESFVKLFFDTLKLPASSRVQLGLKVRLQNLFMSFRKLDIRKIRNLKPQQISIFIAFLLTGVVFYNALDSYVVSKFALNNNIQMWFFPIIYIVVFMSLILMGRFIWLNTRLPLKGKLTFRDNYTDQEISINLSSIWNSKKISFEYLSAIGLAGFESVWLQSSKEKQSGIDQEKIDIKITLSDGRQIESLISDGTNIAIPFETWIVDFSVPVKTPERSNATLVEFIKNSFPILVGTIGMATTIFEAISWFNINTFTAPVFVALIGILVFLFAFVWITFSKTVITRKSSQKIVVPRYSLTLRSLALGGLIFVLVGSFAGGYALYRQKQDISSKFVVVVTTLDGPDEQYGLTNEITEKLYASFQEYDDIKIIRIDKVLTDADSARSIGETNLADMIIWGRYRVTNQPNIVINIEMINKSYSFPSGGDSLSVKPYTSNADLASFQIQRRIGSELSTFVTFLSGYVLYQKHDYDLALSRFDSVLNQTDSSNNFLNPDQVLYFRGNTFSALSKYQDAITDYSKAISINPTFASAYLQRGVANTDLRNFDKALDDFNKSIELDSRNSLAFLNRGVIYYQLGQFDMALVDFNQSLALDPNNSDIYINRGLVYSRESRYDQAIDDFDHSIQLNPEVSIAYSNRGYAYLNLNEYEKAIEDFNKAIALEPQNSNAYEDRGVAYLNLGQYDNGVGDLTKAIELNPRSASAYLNRGIAYKLQGLFDLARSDFNKCLEISDNIAFQKAAKEELLQLEQPTQTP